MILAGDRARFAVELELDRERNKHDHAQHWLFGRCRLWIAGHALGDWDDVAPLAPLRVCIEKIWPRTDADLSRLTPTEMFETMHRALYSDDARVDDDVQRDARRFARFRATPPLEQLAGCYIYVVESDTVAIVVGRDVGASGPTIHAHILHGEYEQCMRQAWDALLAEAATHAADNG
jgi:hypothetical protein